MVAQPHPVKGEALYCFITTADPAAFNPELVNSLRLLVRERIGAFASPEVLQYAPALPKTRSGKIMRRLLRKVAMGDKNVGETSTLADPSVIEDLFNNRPQQ